MNFRYIHLAASGTVTVGQAALVGSYAPICVGPRGESVESYSELGAGHAKPRRLVELAKFGLPGLARCRPLAG
ncbi:hypothetical protein T492DRAFT_933896 [Pavlovales sp. CCMP2436]|nr:hypothetical protein T492DRAFT_933896 [Pavlovales sp. CCMP2436]